MIMLMIIKIRDDDYDDNENDKKKKKDPEKVSVHQIKNSPRTSGPRIAPPVLGECWKQFLALLKTFIIIIIIIII